MLIEPLHLTGLWNASKMQLLAESQNDTVNGGVKFNCFLIWMHNLLLPSVALNECRLYWVSLEQIMHVNVAVGWEEQEATS